MFVDQAHPTPTVQVTKQNRFAQKVMLCVWQWDFEGIINPFELLQDLRKRVSSGVFASKPAEWYRRGIEQLAQRWMKVIKNDGIHFEE